MLCSRYQDECERNLLTFEFIIFLFTSNNKNHKNNLKDKQIYNVKNTIYNLTPITFYKEFEKLRLLKKCLKCQGHKSAIKRIYEVQCEC